MACGTLGGTCCRFLDVQRLNPELLFLPVDVTDWSLAGCLAEAAGRDGDEVLSSDVRVEVDYRMFRA